MSGIWSIKLVVGDDNYDTKHCKRFPDQLAAIVQSIVQEGQCIGIQADGTRDELGHVVVHHGTAPETNPRRHL